MAATLYVKTFKDNPTSKEVGISLIHENISDAATLTEDLLGHVVSYMIMMFRGNDKINQKAAIQLFEYTRGIYKNFIRFECLFQAYRMDNISNHIVIALGEFEKSIQDTLLFLYPIESDRGVTPAVRSNSRPTPIACAGTTGAV
jgi:hypothetical protein